MNKNLKTVLGVIFLLCVLGSCARTFASPDYVGTWEVVEGGSTHEWVTFTKDTMIANDKEYDIDIEEKGDSTRISVKDDNGNIQVVFTIAFEDKDNATVYGESTFSSPEVFDIERK